MTLQTPNFNRLLVVAVIDTRAFAKHIHGTNARAACAENIRVQNRQRGAAQIALGNFLDETWNINMRGASGGAWRIETIEAAVRLRHRGNLIERRMNLWKARYEFRVCFAWVYRGHITLLGDAKAGPLAHFRLAISTSRYYSFAACKKYNSFGAVRYMHELQASIRHFVRFSQPRLKNHQCLSALHFRHWNSAVAGRCLNLIINERVIESRCGSV